MMLTLKANPATETRRTTGVLARLKSVGSQPCFKD